MEDLVQIVAMMGTFLVLLILQLYLIKYLGYIQADYKERDNLIREETYTMIAKLAEGIYKDLDKRFMECVTWKDTATCGPDEVTKQAQEDLVEKIKDSGIDISSRPIKPIPEDYSFFTQMDKEE